MDTFSKSDPSCRLLHTIKGVKEKNEGETEFLKNNLNPCWEKTFLIDCIFELNEKLVFQVLDKNQSAGSEDQLMGQVETTVADIVGAKDMKCEFELKDQKGKVVDYTLIVNIDKHTTNHLHIIFQKIFKMISILDLNYPQLSQSYARNLWERSFFLKKPSFTNN